MRICLSFIYVNRKIGGIAMKNNIFTSNKTDGDNWSNVILETGEEYWIYFDITDSELYESIEGLIFAG